MGLKLKGQTEDGFPSERVLPHGSEVNAGEDPFAPMEGEEPRDTEFLLDLAHTYLVSAGTRSHAKPVSPGFVLAGRATVSIVASP